MADVLNGSRRVIRVLWVRRGDDGNVFTPVYSDFYLVCAPAYFLRISGRLSPIRHVARVQTVLVVVLDKAGAFSVGDAFSYQSFLEPVLYFILAARER